METTKMMKEGEECDLLERLAKVKEFGLAEEEMKELLKPEKYIGRCSEQVEEYVKKIKPLIKDINRSMAEINL